MALPIHCSGMGFHCLNAVCVNEWCVCVCACVSYICSQHCWDISYNISIFPIVVIVGDIERLES